MRKPVTKRRPKKTTPTSLPSDLIREADRVDPQERLSIVREDEADNRILECAVAADADAIVTGDRHLLRLRRFRGTSIMSPRDFLDREIRQR